MSKRLLVLSISVIILINVVTPAVDRSNRPFGRGYTVRRRFCDEMWVKSPVAFSTALFL
jgi:hypothetical protein